MSLTEAQKLCKLCCRAFTLKHHKTENAVKMGSTAHLLLASVGAGVEQLEAYGLLPVDARPDVMAFIQTYVDLLRYAEENPTRASAADREQLLQSICCCINDALQVALRDDLTPHEKCGAHLHHTVVNP